jgi:hypothetical protein
MERRAFAPVASHVRRTENALEPDRDPRRPLRRSALLCELSGRSPGLCGEKPLNLKENRGAEEGTRTPTPLRVHGPEPCASANSATSACDLRIIASLADAMQEEQPIILQRRHTLSNVRPRPYNQKNIRDPMMTTPPKLPTDVANQMRELVHDLSNSLETIMQASYLLGQLELPSRGKEWVELVGEAVQNAANINRQLREVLRTQR